MESIYSLGEKYYRISEAYDCAKDALNEEYENNGGEINEVTESMQAELDELERIKNEVIDEVLSAPDEYAAIVKNAEAQKRVLEAELKAVKEEQAKVNARIEARIKRKRDKIEWFKDNIAEAMRMRNVQKIGGSRTENRFCIYFATSKSIETDDDVLLAPYAGRIESLIDSLPKWLTVKTSINKAELKKCDGVEGVTIVENESIQIR